MRRAKPPPLTVTKEMPCPHPNEERSKEEMKDASETTTTMVNSRLDGLHCCCDLVTVWLHGSLRCKSHLLVCLKAHDNKGEEWKAAIKSELL